MIIAKRNGKTYVITAQDQSEIMRLTVANGGDVRKAIADFHEARFGEPFALRNTVPRHGERVFDGSGNLTDEVV